MLPWVYLKVPFTSDVLPDLHRCLTGVKALHFLLEEKLPHQPSLGGLGVGGSFCSFLPHSSQSQNMKRLPVPGGGVVNIEFTIFPTILMIDLI